MKRMFTLLLTVFILSWVLPLAGFQLALAVQEGEFLPVSASLAPDSGQSEAASPVSSQPAASSLLPDRPVEADLPESGEAAPSSEPPAEAASGSDRPAVLRSDYPLRILDRDTKEILTVSVRDFLIGAMAAEMDPAWPDEALKAQAVAAYTYALYTAADSGTEAYDLTAAPARREVFVTAPVMQSYYGAAYNDNLARLSALADQVLGLAVTWEGRPALTTYYAISNGRTRSSQEVWGGAIPYLTAVDSADDREQPQCLRTLVYTVPQMRALLTQNLGLVPEGDPAGWFGPAVLDGSGYVNRMEVCGKTVSGLQVRSALSLRSACFTVTPVEDGFSVSTWGYGHCVGLSQHGARLMAEAGSSFEQILAHYYPGTTVEWLAAE